MSASTTATTRHDWSLAEVKALFQQPFNDLLFQAQTVHRAHFDPNRVQVSTLLSIKTGACPEDCKYCPQSGHYNTGLEKQKLMEVQKVLEEAARAKAIGSTRFCMGAAWKHPSAKDMPYVLEMVKGVKAMGLETCMTLGKLDQEQTAALAQAGLDYYNHNLDTSPEFYGSIITTRTYSERLQTLAYVRDAGMKICSGGILGMGESLDDRAGLLIQLANLPEHPESVPINMLVKVAGTALSQPGRRSGLLHARSVGHPEPRPDRARRLTQHRAALSDVRSGLRRGHSTARTHRRAAGARSDGPGAAQPLSDGPEAVLRRLGAHHPADEAPLQRAAFPAAGKRSRQHQP